MPYGYGIGGGYGSVGGSAAAGIQSGFQMGREFDNDADRRKQVAFENARQTAADTERTAQTERTNRRQDVVDANTEDDRAMAGANSSLEDARFQLGALHAQYPDGNIPDTEAKPLYTAVGQAHAARQALISKRWQPVLDAEQQKWRDFASKAQVGQVDPNTLRGSDLRNFIKATTGHDLGDFDSGKIDYAINDATTGLATKNPGLAIRAADTLMGPQIKQGIGHIAPDGSQIVDKSLYALLPAPAAPSPGGQGGPTGSGMVPGTGGSGIGSSPVQGLAAALNQATAPQDTSHQPSVAQTSPVSPSGPPTSPADDSQVTANTGSAAAPSPYSLTAGTDPNSVIPVLQVTTRQPDGTLTQYHAPPTDGRGTDPNATISQPLKMDALMDRMGGLGTVSKWLQTPEMAGAVKDALKDSSPTTFEQAWGMVHGDPKAFQTKDDPTSLKIAALTKAAKEAGIPFADYVRQFEGKGTPAASGVQSSLNAIHAYGQEQGLSDKEAATEMQGLGLLRAPTKEDAGSALDKKLATIEKSDLSPEDKVQAKRAALMGAGAAGLGSREGIFVNRILIAANEATKDLANIARLPIQSDTGFFGGRKQGPGLLDAGKESLTKAMTTQEVQSYQVRSTGLQRSMAAIEAAGLAPGGVLSTQMEAVQAHNGDSQQTRMEKLAQTRQIIDAGLETTLANPKLSDQQRTHINEIVASLHKSIPFTLADIDKLGKLQEVDPNTTMNQVIKMRGLNKSSGPAISPAAGPAPGGAAASLRALGAPSGAISTQADYDALPSGATYTAPDGTTRTKK